MINENFFRDSDSIADYSQVVFRLAPEYRVMQTEFAINPLNIVVRNDYNGYNCQFTFSNLPFFSHL